MPRQEALAEHCIEKIQQDGFVSLGFGMTGADIDPLFGSFAELIDETYNGPRELGQHIVNALAVETPGRPYDSRGFIERRRIGEISAFEVGRGPATENKDQMHVTPRTAEFAQEYFRTRGRMPAVLRTMVDQCVEVHAAVRKSVQPVARALGIEETMLAPRGKERGNVHLLRLLHYLPLSEDDQAKLDSARQHDALAELHFDRSKLTAALWESGPGLVGAPGDNGHLNPELSVDGLDAMAARALSSPVAHRSGELKLFAGAGYNHLPQVVRDASGNIPPLLHGVTNPNPGKPRDAIVLFMNEHAGATLSAPLSSETGFNSVRQFLMERALAA